MAVVGGELAVMQHKEGKSRGCFLYIAHNSIFKDSHIIQLLYCRKQGALNFGACGVLMVKYPVHTVTALKRPVVVTVRLFVKVAAKLDKPCDIYLCLVHKYICGNGVVFKATRNKGIVLVVFGAVLRTVVNACDTALGKSRVAKVFLHF